MTDTTEKRLADAYATAMERIRHLPDNDPNLGRAIAKMKQTQLALRRYQAKRK